MILYTHITTFRLILIMFVTLRINFVCPYHVSFICLNFCVDFLEGSCRSVLSSQLSLSSFHDIFGTTISFRNMDSKYSWYGCESCYPLVCESTFSSIWSCRCSVTCFKIYQAFHKSESSDSFDSLFGKDRDKNSYGDGDFHLKEVPSIFCQIWFIQMWWPFINFSFWSTDQVCLGSVQIHVAFLFPTFLVVFFYSLSLCVSVCWFSFRSFR